MSYDKPTQLLDKKDLRLLETFVQYNAFSEGLALVGLQIGDVNYYNNEYCPNKDGDGRICRCPYWFHISIARLPTRIYEPNVWIWIKRRKRVWELEYEGFVEKDFWIHNEEVTQEPGKYIHAWTVKKMVEYISIIYQAAEIKNYSGQEYIKYYAKLFRKGT